MGTTILGLELCHTTLSSFLLISLSFPLSSDKHTLSAPPSAPYRYHILQTFLLEKIRVVRQSHLERNYHIFYILAAGASAKDREHWELKPPQTYHYMNQSSCYDRRDGVKDIDLHIELQEAFGTMGFDKAAQDDCLGCVAAILALGNLAFEQIPGAKDDEQQARLEGTGASTAAGTAARLLGVTTEALVHCLTARKVTAGTTHVTIFLTPEQAAHARDAMAKALYGEWLL